jgi:hypothetical protein
MTERIPSVTDTYFQHKVLTKIHGQPSYQSLQTVSTELKANASSVPSTLGGGRHGHLGLLLSPARYITLPNATAWITPGNPGAFAPPAAGTAAQIEASRDVWRELKQNFALCQATDKALISQLVEAIDPIYLRAMLNRATGQYSGSIRAILAQLFQTYGKVTPQQIKAKEFELYQMHYDISQPVDTVFNAIDDLSDLADQAISPSPLSQQQMIDIAYVIFAKQPLLQNDLRIWNRLPAANRTYANLIRDLRDAQNDLRALPTASDVYHQQPPHHNANIATIADLVLQRLLDEQGQGSPSPPVEQAPRVEPPPVDSFAETANSLQRRETDLQSREAAMRTQMQEMMSSMMRNNNANNNNNNGNRNNGNRNNRNNGNRNGNRNNNGNPNNNNNNNNNNNGNPNDNNTNRNNGNINRSGKYCWTHGACAHDSCACRTPGQGHQTAATFANMMGGSTHGCFWL